MTEENEGASHVGLYGRILQGRGNGNCKRLEKEAWLVDSRDSKKVRLAGAE